MCFKEDNCYNELRGEAMNIFIEKRSIFFLFLTMIYVVIGIVFIFVMPNGIEKNSDDKMKKNIELLAQGDLGIKALSESYQLFIYESDISSLITKSGEISNIDSSLEAHLIMWAQDQEVEAVFYQDDFGGENFIYYILVEDNSNFVVAFSSTIETENLIAAFKSYSLTLVIVLYIISLIVGGTFVNTLLINKLSTIDAKTNLFNKSYLTRLFKNKKLTNNHFVYINIHNFEDIVDACGINFTDMITSNVVGRLRELFNQQELYRLSEDEYVVVSNITINVEHIFDSFKEGMKGHEGIDTYDFRIKVVSLDLESLKYLEIDELLKLFSFGYSKIKTSVVNSICIDSDMMKEMNNQMFYQGNLLNALTNEKLINFYQVKVNPSTNEIVGCEALSRWYEDGEVILPGKYISLAEANGLIYEIDLLSFRNSCKLISKLDELNILSDNFKISSNLSPITLKNLKFKTLKDIIDEFKVDIKHLSVEVTESVTIDFEIVQNILDEISKSGITIEIDDFSAGNSSFTILPLLKANVLKLDMAILPKDPNNKNEAFIYKGLVDISKKLGFKLTAEGVETKVQVDFVKSIGVDTIQGYYYSRPISETDFIKFIKEF